jgi:GrpB-like predicted nucleotidyltransferase (UPF0157 family)
LIIDQLGNDCQRGVAATFGRVLIADHDPGWADRFAEQSAVVSVALEPWLAGPVEHVGSTSVPGLAAKPIVDMLAPVRSLADARGAVAALEPGDWLFWPDDPNGDWRLWFLHPTPEARTHHLHVIEHDHPQAVAMLAFRDALRADPVLRDDYVDLKRRLASEHTDNRNAYTNAKSAFVAETLRALGVDAPPPDQLPE